jgi:hypothetical protein
MTFPHKARAHHLGVEQEGGSFNLRVEGFATQQAVGWHRHLREVRFTPSDLVMESIHPSGLPGNVVAPWKKASKITILEAVFNLLFAKVGASAPRGCCRCNTVLRTTQSLATVGACSVSLTFEPFGDASLAELVPALAGKPHRFDHDLLTDRTFRALDWLQFRGEELLFRGEGLESHLCELREE